MYVKTKNRNRLKRREIRDIITELEDTFIGNYFEENLSIEKGEIEGVIILFLDGEPCFMMHNNKIVFTLYGLNKYKPKENFVVVDMGAVKFVTSGADVMSPGIVDSDKNIKEGDQVWICDERHHKPLAVGTAIMNGEKMISEKKGKSVKVIHYVGDKVWRHIAEKI